MANPIADAAAQLTAAVPVALQLAAGAAVDRVGVGDCPDQGDL